LGYINESGTTLGNGEQGAHQEYDKYVTVKSNDEIVYHNFNWILQETGKIGKETFKAKGVYHHFNGTRYFSIYDLSNKWIGYIPENSIDEKTTHLFVMGHGSSDPGAVGNGTNERDFTRKELLPYLQKYAKKLKNNEIVFYDTARNMYVDSQKKEGVHSVQDGLSSITEIHLDAAGIGATGGHVIVHPKKKSYIEDLKLANVVKTYNGLWGGVSKNNGLSYRQDLLNLNLSYDYDVSYRLVELGFITNYQDLVKLRVNLDRIAKEFIEVVTGEEL
ncbi:N-acetylmuramoyl-L-alanine amidase, partial [Enterococcus eurekensis]